MIKMEKRISFLQTPFVLLQKGTPIFQKQKEGFKFLHHVKFLIHPLFHFYPLCLLTLPQNSAHRRSGGLALLFLQPQHQMGLVVNAFTPGKETGHPLSRRLGEHHGRSRRERKISPPTGIRSPDRHSQYRVAKQNELSRIPTHTFQQYPPNCLNFLVGCKLLGLRLHSPRLHTFNSHHKDSIK